MTAPRTNQLDSGSGGQTRKRKANDPTQGNDIYGSNMTQRTVPCFALSAESSNTSSKHQTYLSLAQIAFVYVHCLHMRSRLATCNVWVLSRQENAQRRRPYLLSGQHRRCLISSDLCSTLHIALPYEAGASMIFPHSASCRPRTA